jgi:Family of unknown function (DUF6624)
MNEQLKKELISMANEDNRVLQELHDSGELGTLEYHPKITKVHERNTSRIKAIIKEYGWPGNDLVGTHGADAAWYITQHSVLDTEFMNTCLPLLQDAVANNQAEGRHLAFLLDRTLTMAGKPQKYGTQFKTNEEGKTVPFPIENLKMVDNLRVGLGLETLAERTRYMQSRDDELVSNRKKAHPKDRVSDTILLLGCMVPVAIKHSVGLLKVH